MLGCALAAWHPAWELNIFRLTLQLCCRNTTLVGHHCCGSAKSARLFPSTCVALGSKLYLCLTEHMCAGLLCQASRTQGANGCMRGGDCLLQRAQRRAQMHLHNCTYYEYCPRQKRLSTPVVQIGLCIAIVLYTIYLPVCELREGRPGFYICHRSSALCMYAAAQPPDS